MKEVELEEESGDENSMVDLEESPVNIEESTKEEFEEVDDSKSDLK